MDEAEKPDEGLLKPIGAGEASPGPKETDSLAQLPEHIAQALPEPTAAPASSESSTPAASDLLTPAFNSTVDPKLLDPHNVLGKKNVFPGLDGIPFRGPVPDLKQDDKQPQTGYQARVKIFDLSDEKQLLEYTQVMQICANGLAQIGAEERIYDKSSKNWRVFIRWWELFLHKAAR